MEEVNKISYDMIGCALKVHKELGPGLLESTYEACLSHELIKKGLSVERQKGLPVNYRGNVLENGYRVDLLVEGKLVVEIKSIEAIAPVHIAQVMTYIKLSDNRLGLLINFNVDILKLGIKRIIL